MDHQQRHEHWQCSLTSLSQEGSVSQSHTKGRQLRIWHLTLWSGIAIRHPTCPRASCLSGTTRKGTECTQCHRATRVLPWSKFRHRMGWHQQEAIVYPRWAWHLICEYSSDTWAVFITTSVSMFATGIKKHILEFWIAWYMHPFALDRIVGNGMWWHAYVHHRIAMLNTQPTTAISDTVDSDSQCKPNQNKKDESICPVSWRSSGDHTSRGRLTLSTGFASGSVTFHQLTSVSWSPGSRLATGFEAIDGETKRNWGDKRNWWLRLQGSICVLGDHINNNWVEMSEGWRLRKVGTTLLTFQTKKLNVTSLPATQSKVGVDKVDP